MPSQNILIVDDENISRQLLQAILLNIGYNVEAASSGHEALNILEKSIPDLVFLDIMMPEMDGFETIEAIKNQPKFASIPIVFVTALDDKDTKVKGKKLGATDFITKPYNKNQISSKLNEIFQSDVQDQN